MSLSECLPSVNVLLPNSDYPVSVVPIDDVPPFIVMNTCCPSLTRSVGVVVIIFIVCGVVAVLVVPA